MTRLRSLNRQLQIDIDCTLKETDLLQSRGIYTHTHTHTHTHRWTLLHINLWSVPLIYLKALILKEPSPEAESGPEWWMRLHHAAYRCSILKWPAGPWQDPGRSRVDPHWAQCLAWYLILVDYIIDKSVASKCPSVWNWVFMLHIFARSCFFKKLKQSNWQQAQEIYQFSCNQSSATEKLGYSVPGKLH